MLTGLIIYVVSFHTTLLILFRECFVPMSELSNLKKFTGYINLEKLRSLCALKKNSSVSSWNS